jgi:hypothetical protein
MFHKGTNWRSSLVPPLESFGNKTELKGPQVISDNNMVETSERRGDQGRTLEAASSIQGLHDLYFWAFQFSFPVVRNYRVVGQTQ